MLRLETKPTLMTVPAALRELGKTEMLRRGNDKYKLDHAISKRQKTILSAFGMDVASTRSLAVEVDNLLVIASR